MTLITDSEVQNARAVEPLRLNSIVWAAVVALFGVSLVFRLLWLDRIPGIDGDEGWYGVQVTRMLHGKEWSPLTPSKLPINPQLFLTEAAVLLVLEPSGFVLRLPIAIWACVGIALTYRLHSWVFGDRVEAVLTALVTACLPAHLAYSRFCWDSSFAWVSLPILLYATLRIVSRAATSTAWVCLVIGAILTVWTHATHAVFVVACLLAIGWTWFKPWCRRAWTTKNRRQPIAVLGVAVLVVCVVMGQDLLIRSVAYGDMWLASRWSIGRRLIATLLDLMTGVRAYEYIAGVPRPSWTGVLYSVTLVASGACLLALVRSEWPADRTLAMLFPMLLGMLLVPVVSNQLRYGSLSYERYVIYFVPLGITAFVRAMRALGGRMGRWGGRVPPIVSIAIAGLFLAQFWHYYFDALREHTYWERLRVTPQRTFGTGPIEPKQAAADAILKMTDLSAPLRVYAEDYFIRQPLDYLMGGRFEVQERSIQFESRVRICVVGYSGASQLAEAQTAANQFGWKVTEQFFGDSRGNPIVTLLVLEESDRSVAGERADVAR